MQTPAVQRTAPKGNCSRHIKSQHISRGKKQLRQFLCRLFWLKFSRGQFGRSSYLSGGGAVAGKCTGGNKCTPSKKCPIKFPTSPFTCPRLKFLDLISIDAKEMAILGRLSCQHHTKPTLQSGHQGRACLPCGSPPAINAVRF